jgi:hypothetical protein
MFVKKLATISLLSISTVYFSQEKNLKNITKLTFGGDNAEAYFSQQQNAYDAGYQSRNWCKM